MQEDFLHYIWRYKKFDVPNIKTTNLETISIISVGDYNQNSGPDFFNSQLNIDNQLWAGNVEIHLRSSDWFVHNHEVDKAYDNVILHVVWEHDTDIFRRDNSVIPTLEIKSYIDNGLIKNYEKLFLKDNKWINCENDFAQVDEFVLQNWLERLYFERLERKAFNIEQLLAISKNDWESVLFKMLAKNFGLKVNGDAFLSMANSLDFSVIRKSKSNQTNLEALLFGQAGLLQGDIQESYFIDLVKQYAFLKQKFKLSNTQVSPVLFFRLRPPNFPTIRLSQLANIYHKHHNLFSKIIETNVLNDFYEVFNMPTSPFWQTHFTFNKTSKKSDKKISKAFMDLLLINTIIPIKFSYAKHQGKNIDDAIITLIQQIASEKNNIINKFDTLKKVSSSALQSQSLIQLKTEYCDKNKCLQCAIGNALIIK
ncbi:DUF2851 family protein [Yeosuana sp.]|uniref:DUF2851 family protein n=1 Tax=Yeosuana sp. TaxID=2529388 RepID=UPI0040552C4C